MLNEETLYSRFITGALSEQEIVQLKQSGDWEKLDKIAKATSELTLPAFDKEANFQKILHEKKSQTGKAKTPVKLYSRLIQSIAAIFVLVVGSYLLFSKSLKTLESKYATTQSHIFEDNSNVVLNAGTSLQFDETNWTSMRKVILDGEAYFNVEKGVKFLVETGAGTIEVLGTSFNVKARDNNLYVECYEGKVRVNYKGQSKDLSKREAIYFTEVGSRSDTLNIENPVWENGRSKFRDENLRHVLDEVERQYNIQVVSNHVNLKFTGVFTNENVMQAAEQISRPLGLKFKFSDDEKTLTFSNSND